MKEEDDGIVVFPALNGNEGNILYHIKCKNDEEISVAGPFPHIPYSAHGHFYQKIRLNKNIFILENMALF